MAFIEISRKNLFHNLKQIENKVGNKDKISVCLKNNAYGHGLELMAKLCSEYGVQKAVVINLQEANIISKYFKSIIVLLDIPSEDIEENIEITINDLESIKKNP